MRLSYLAKSETRFRHSLRMGYMEDNFLRDVTGDRETDPYADVEPLGRGGVCISLNSVDP